MLMASLALGSRQIRIDIVIDAVGRTLRGIDVIADPVSNTPLVVPIGVEQRVDRSTVAP
jgi:hypothetical protein